MMNLKLEYNRKTFELLALLFIILLFVNIEIPKYKEKFWSYDRLRDKFYCQYVDGTQPQCKILNRNYNQFKRNLKPIGIIHTVSEDNDKSYPLYGWYDYRIRRKIYHTKRLFHHNDPRIHTIPTNSDLVDGEIIYLNIDGKRREYKVQLHDLDYKYDVWSVGTRYNYYDVPWQNVGYLENKGKTFTLFEKELDPSRYVYKYAIRDEFGTYIHLPDKKYLDDGDYTTIPSKEKLGKYKVYRYSLEEMLLQ